MPAQSNQAGQALTVWEPGSYFGKGRLAPSGRLLDRRMVPIELPSPARTAWQDQAGCRGRDDLDTLFFPSEGRRTARVDAEIADMCCRCPVQVECLTYAIETRSEGVWAATTTAEREVIRKRQLPGEQRRRIRRAETKDWRSGRPQPPTPTAEAVGRNTDPLPRQSLRDGQETR